MIDIVFSNNNETEFLQVAEKLGIKELIFVYQTNLCKNKLENRTAIICDAKNVESARKLADFVVVKSTGDDRFAMEHAKPDFMFGFEEIAKKDFLHQRASGLNQVLCSIAAKNNITILFPFSTILNAQNSQRPLLLGRMMQNAFLCKKYKTPYSFVSLARSPKELRGPQDLKSFFKLMGVNAEL